MWELNIILAGLLIVPYHPYCRHICSSPQQLITMNFSEKDILTKLDSAFLGSPDTDFPLGKAEDVYYNFFLDLEMAYTFVAGSKIHLYGDQNRWAIVFERNGYDTRGESANIELTYVGNCITYHVDHDQENNRTYYSNSSSVSLISQAEFERIRNKHGKEMEVFEMISADAKNVMVHGHLVHLVHEKEKYEAIGIHLREDDNPKNLIGFEQLVRYISDTNPSVFAATDSEIRQYIPKDLKEIMTIDKFHFSSVYDKAHPPSSQEMFEQIAKVLVIQNPNEWKPTRPANNHWSNWESGML